MKKWLIIISIITILAFLLNASEYSREQEHKRLIRTCQIENAKLRMAHEQIELRMIYILRLSYTDDQIRQMIPSLLEYFEGCGTLNPRK